MAASGDPNTAKNIIAAKAAESQFTPEEVTALKSTFAGIDSDNNGYLNETEFTSFLTKCKLDTRFVKAIFKVFDENNDLQLSFPEFMKYLQACIDSEADSRHLFRMIFDSIDGDHNGSLSIDEMMQFGDLCGLKMTKEQAIHEVSTIDSDGNGTVEFTELCKAFGI